MNTIYIGLRGNEKTIEFVTERDIVTLYENLYRENRSDFADFKKNLISEHD